MNPFKGTADIQNNSDEIFEYAAWYLKEGFNIIPIGEDGQPLIASWKQYNTQENRVTMEDVQKWYEQWPDMKLGAVTGKGSMYIVIHVRKGGNVNRWQITTRSKTSDGGTNLFFWHPAEPYYKSVTVPSAKDILPLTDVYGEDDFVILPSYDGEGEWIEEPDDFRFAHMSFDDVPLIIEDPEWELTDPPEVLKLVAEERQRLEQAKQQHKLLDAKTANAGKLHVWTIGDILAHDFGEEEWLVESLISKQGITALSGNPGDFKTWVTIHIALCVSRNALVFGKFATTQGGVLVIDEEDHIRVVKGRLELLGAQNGDNIHYLSQSGFKADSEKALQAVVDFVKEKNIKLVILDSLVRIHGQEENDATGMAKVFGSIQKLIAAGASILFTHHHRKQYGFSGNNNPGQSMRGSSDILAAVDSHITIERKRDEEGNLVIKQTKLRQAEVLKPFEISILKGPSGPSGFEYAGDHDDKKIKAAEVAEALVFVLADGMKSRPDIHDGLKSEFGKTAIDDGIKTAKEAGIIEKVPADELPKEERRKAYYRLPGASTSILDLLPVSQSLVETEKQEDDAGEEHLEDVDEGDDENFIDTHLTE